MKIRTFIAFLFICNTIVYSQTKTWQSDLLVSYRTTDANGKLLNSIVIKKDTLNYEWLEKNKAAHRILVGDSALENKLLMIMNKHKILKFKSAKNNASAPSMVFVHTKNGKQKTIVMPQNIKPGSKEELFVKEFLEAIVIKVFVKELNNYPQ
jgi:hypothetical protein